MYFYYEWCNAIGIELNFIRLLHNFKIYIQGELLLPVILVQNQIIYIIIGKVHTLVQCASVEIKVIGS